MTPGCALRLMRAAPHLTMDVIKAGDMLDPEEWGAITSPPGPDGVSDYRLMLWRIWQGSRSVLVVIMLNPSKASHLVDDNTVKGLVKRARRLGFGGLVIVNCFDLRATDPGDMKRHPNPLSPDGDAAIEAALNEVVGHGATLLCAWGVHAVHLNRQEEIECAISSKKAERHVLRLCIGGAPEHPLYIPQAAGLTKWHGISPAS